jgi:glycosyltransferase involved in cell wall biosynthesis
MISVVIPTYNRFKCLLESIESVKSQTYKDIEIIIVNDASTQSEYYSHDFSGCKIIHLPINSKTFLGNSAPGYVRNIGIANSSGKYIAFLDDDDIWFSNKLETQLDIMKKYGCKMACTEGYYGEGKYDPSQQYQFYNKEYFYKILSNIFNYKQKHSLFKLIDNESLWNKEFLDVHNCIITSSVLVEKDLIKQVGYFNQKMSYSEDYDLWMKILDLTDCIWINQPLMYYDGSHGLRS